MYIYICMYVCMYVCMYMYVGFVVVVLASPTHELTLTLTLTLILILIRGPPPLLVVVE